MYKEMYEELVKAAVNDEDPDFIRQSITMCMQSFSAYVDVVYNMEVQIKIGATRYEGDDYRNFVMNLDAGRRAAHESAISHCSMLNKICKMLGVQEICDCDINDRYAVADFCMAITKEIFDKRQR